MKKFLLSLAAVFTSVSMMAETTTVYSWDGSTSSTANETGGVATAQGGNASTVVGKASKTNWCLSLGKGYSSGTHYIKITLDDALKEGDRITTGCFVTGNSRPTADLVYGINFAGENEVTLTYDADDEAASEIPYLNTNAAPADTTFTIPAEAAGKKEIWLYRKSGSTTLLVSKFVVTREGKQATTATITVDAADFVTITNESRETVAAGEVAPGNYIIQPNSEVGDYKLYQVTQNDEVVATASKDATYYMLEIAAGDKVAVTSQYPAAYYTVSSNDYAGIFSIAGQSQIAGPTKVDAGYKCEVVLAEGYTSADALSFYATEDVTINVTKQVLATATIDNASKVKITTEAGEVAVVNGTQKLSAGQYMISSTVAGYKLASVKVNGEAKTPVAGAAYWMIELAENDQLEITADYEEEAYGISFNDAAAIKSVSSMYNGGTDLQIMTGGEGETAFASTAAPAGYMVNVVLNDDYKAFTATSFYATEDVEFTTKHLVYATITCDAGNRVKATEEETRESFVLAEGENKVVAGNYIITSNDANYILNKVTKGDEVITAPYGYYMVEIAEGETLDVVSKWVDGDGEPLESIITIDDQAAVASVTYAGVDITEQGIAGGEELESAGVTYVVGQGAKVIITLNENYETQATLAFYATEEVYTITTNKLTYATIVADAAGKAKATNAETRNEIVLQEGINKVLAGDYMILTNDANYALKSVVKGDEVIDETYGYYMVTLAEGETATVTSKWLDEYGEQLIAAIVVNDLAAIASVTAAGNDITNQVAPSAWDEDDNAIAYSFAAPMGTKVIFTLNEGYKSASTLNFYATEEVYEIVTTKLADIKATITIADASIARVHVGGSIYGDVWGLDNGENEITVKENNNVIVIEPTAGKNIAVAQNGTYIAMENGGYKVTLAEGDKIVISELPLAEGDYLIYNVAAKQYLGGGHQWGTRASVGKPQWFTAALKDGAYTLDSHQSNGGDNHYLGNGDFVDAIPFAWTITKAEDGTCTISGDIEGIKYLSAAEVNGTVDRVAEAGANAKWQFISKAEFLATLANATPAADVDATALIYDPELKRNGNTSGYWTITGFNGTGNPGNFAQGQNGNNATCAESWHSNNGFKAVQTITLPYAGKYSLTAQAFYRQDDNMTENKPYLFAGEQKFEFPVLSGTENNMVEAYASFLENKYPVTPIEIVTTEDNQTVEIGFAGDATHMWNIFGELTLTYSADAASFATVNVDLANRAKLTDRNYNETVLAAGKNYVKPGEYMLVSADANYALKEVKKGDKVIAETWGYRQVELAAGDVLDVTAAWLEDGEQMVSAISFNDAAAIKAVTAAGDTLAIAEAEGNYFTAAPMGTKVIITLNEGYTSNAALNFYATEEVYEITTTKLALATVNIDNAALVKIQNINYETITVVDGAQKISAGQYMVSPTADYKFNKVELNGETLKPAYGTAYMVELAANDTLDITALYEEEAYGISFNDAAAIKSVTTMYGGGTELEIMTGGEGETTFASTAAPAGYKVIVTLNAGYTTENATAFYATEDVEFVTEKLTNIVIAEGGVVGYITSFTIKARNYGEMFQASGAEGKDIVLMNKTTRETVYTWTAEMLTAIEPTFDEEYMPIALTITLPDTITAPGTYDLVVAAGAFYVGEDMDASDEATTTVVIEAPTAGLQLVSSEFTAEGGKLTFDQSVAFADFAEEVVCNVSNVKTKVIAAQATLTLDYDDWNAVVVTFSETLEAGNYTLDIPAGVIIDGEQGTASYAGGQIAFEVTETGIQNIMIDRVNGKYMQNGKVYIVVDGKIFDAAGSAIK